VRVGTRSRYSVRLLVALARLGPQPVSLGVVSRSEGIPRAYLARLASALREAGLVRSWRGAQGGYALAKPTGAIRLHDVVAAAEGQVTGVPCFQGPSGCDRYATCAARVLWRGMSDAVESFLRTTTLKDLAGQLSGEESHGCR
jgi:Rrf2 family protein